MRSLTAGSAPIAKIANAGYVGAVVTVAVWALRTYGRTEIPPEVAAAATLIASGLVGYLTPLQSDEIKAH